MERIRLDRIDLAPGAPAREHLGAKAEKKPTEAGHREREVPIKLGYRGQPRPVRQVEEQRVQPVDDGAHRQHHHAGDHPDNRREDDKARFASAHERAQAARNLDMRKEESRGHPWLYVLCGWRATLTRCG